MNWVTNSFLCWNGIGVWLYFFRLDCLWIGVVESQTNSIPNIVWMLPLGIDPVLDAISSWALVHNHHSTQQLTLMSLPLASAIPCSDTFFCPMCQCHDPSLCLCFYCLLYSVRVINQVVTCMHAACDSWMCLCKTLMWLDLQTSETWSYNQQGRNRECANMEATGQHSLVLRRAARQPQLLPFLWLDVGIGRIS